MVVMVKAPSFSRNVFSGNELSGWMDGVQYTTRRELRKQIKKANKENKARKQQEHDQLLATQLQNAPKPTGRVFGRAM